MNAMLPTTIPAYLAQLRRSLEGADPAMIQDALYDAEEYLRAELAANPERSEAGVIADVAGSYGAPDEVADIYRETEARVEAALRPGSPRPALAPSSAPSLWRRVFGVFRDARSYGALFYMLLSVASGLFLFLWTAIGMSLSLGMSLLIIGLPFFVLFVGASRVLALAEGRAVEALLGERMPRRPQTGAGGLPLLARIAEMFRDPRTWGTFLYFLLMLPLGITYFVIAMTGLLVSLSLMLAPLARLFTDRVQVVLFDQVDLVGDYPLLAPLLVLGGFLTLTLTMHLARVIGRWHGLLAKHLLVKV